LEAFGRDGVDRCDDRCVADGNIPWFLGQTLGESSYVGHQFQVGDLQLQIGAWYGGLDPAGGVRQALLVAADQDGRHPFPGKPFRDGRAEPRLFMMVASSVIVAPSL
jgi:hypothetical protein